jgi:hypothetical protein
MGFHQELVWSPPDTLPYKHWTLRRQLVAMPFDKTAVF